MVVYATRADIEAVFGTINVEKWADLNNEKVSADIAARITSAIAVATAYIDDRLRDGTPYTFPLAAGLVVPTTIVDICAKWAGVWLYESRGIADTDEKEHRLTHHKEYVDKVLDSLTSGKLTLSLVQAIFSTAPSVIDVSVVKDAVI